MDLSLNTFIWAIIGAICLLVVTGGFLSMSDQEPTTGALATGAAAGAGLGAAAAKYLGGGSDSNDDGGAANILKAVMSGGEPTMKVGLPGF